MHFKRVYCHVGLGFALAVMTAGRLDAQEAPGTPAPRVTPLGTQLPPGMRLGLAGPKAAEPAITLPKEPVNQTVERALSAAGGRGTLASVTDSAAEGTLTYFTIAGPGASFPVTVLRKGPGNVQRIIRQPGIELREGTDGRKTWESGMGSEAPAQGRALAFIESQTVRSVEALLDYQTKRLTLNDAGARGTDRVIEASSRDGKVSRYSIDPVTSRVTRMEFTTATARDLFGNTVPLVEAFVYSDFRTVQGVLTPFKIERYSNGLKVEEMLFTTVRYNTSVKDTDFRP